MHTDRNALFQNLWRNYQEVTPSAAEIHRILGAEEGQAIINDHIALRTFNRSPVGLEALAEHFLKLGYRQGGEYHFEAKKLYARHYEHPDAEAPKVFISELLVEQCSPGLQATVDQLVREPLESFAADDLAGFFRARGHQDLFPAWRAEELDAEPSERSATLAQCCDRDLAQVPA